MIMMTKYVKVRAGLAGLCLLVLAASVSLVLAGEGNTAAASKEAVDSAAAIAAYPLNTCVVSGDKLEDGDMGAPINFVYKQEGQSDRLVRLCCKNCIKKFNKEPAKYLKLIDAAAVKSEKPATSGDHTSHSH
jgi:hypothetical protein